MSLFEFEPDALEGDTLRARLMDMERQLGREVERLREDIAQECRYWQRKFGDIALTAEADDAWFNSLGELQGNTYRVDQTIAAYEAANDLLKLVRAALQAHPKKKKGGRK